MIGPVSHYYKHKNGIDVAFFLTNKVYTEEGVEISGMWVNIHDLEVNGIDPYACTGEIDKYLLTPEAEANWYLYDVEEHRYCRRKDL